MILTPNEIQLQRRGQRLQRRWQQKRQRLQQSVVRKQRDRTYWRIMARAMKQQWRRCHDMVPQESRKEAMVWLRGWLKQKDHIALLRFYLLLLPLTLPECREECDQILKPR